MAYKLIWSPEAADDLEATYKFIAKDSPEHARRFVEDVVQLVDSVPDFPHAGRVAPRYGAHYRERLHGDYRILYRVLPDAIEIVAIVHGYRDLPRGNI